MTTQELLEVLGEADDAFIMEAGRKQHPRTENKAEEPGKDQKPTKAAKAAAAGTGAGALSGIRALWKKKTAPKAPAVKDPMETENGQTAPETENQEVQSVPESPAEAAVQAPEQTPAAAETAAVPEAEQQERPELTVTMERAEAAEYAEAAEPAAAAEVPAAAEAAAVPVLTVLAAEAAGAECAESLEAAEAPEVQSPAEAEAAAEGAENAEDAESAEAAETAENTENTENTEDTDAAGETGAVLPFPAAAENPGSDSGAEPEAEAGEEPKEESEEPEAQEDGADGKKTVKRLLPVLVAACLLLVVVGAGASAMLYHLTKPDSSEAAEAAVAAAAPEETAPAENTVTMQAAEEPEEEAAASEESAGTEDAAAAEAWQLTPLGQAAEVTAPDSWDESNEVSAETANAINMFSYETAAEILTGTDSSVCYSPLSLYQTLAVLASGAEGETRSQILSLMGLSSADTLAEEIQKSVRWNTKNEERSVLQIANSIWLDDTSADGTPIDYNQDWVVTASNDYYADVYAADFSDQVAIDSTLGGWVAEKTGGLLTPTAAEMGLTSDTVMAIINTLNYQTEWAEAFSEEDTSEDTFTTAAGEEISTEFMHTTIETGSVIHGSDYTKSRLILTTGKMIIVLPDEGVDIDDLLTEDKLIEIFENSGYQSAKVSWSIPKFDTTNAATDLSGMLQDLGVTDAFSADSADFSTISDSPLYLSSIRQGTHITVNESGIQAAAWTAAGMELSAAPAEEAEEVEMNLNRPFLYLITSDDGSTLFMGVVRNPQS